jgi:hypothetical protein
VRESLPVDGDRRCDVLQRRAARIENDRFFLARTRSTRFRRATCAAQLLSELDRKVERRTPVADAPLEDARRISPERLAMGDVQIAAREPDISEHVIVQIREAREFPAMFDACDEPAPASGSTPRRWYRSKRTGQSRGTAR